MNTISQDFQVYFERVLKKVGVLSRMQIEALLLVMMELVIDPRFSIKRVAEKSGGKFTRKFLTQTVKHYGRHQGRVRELLLQDILSELPRNKRLVLSVDDTLVKKSGKTIYGANRWYDHCLKTVYTAFCIVDLALVVGGKAVFVMPWLVVKQGTARKTGKTGKTRKNQEQGIKSRLALQLLDQIVPVLQEAGWQRERIFAVMDSWFSSRHVLSWLRGKGYNFRTDGKKNYQVQIPDKDRIKSRGKKKRGRPCKRFVKYVSIEVYFGDPLSWNYFTCPFTGKTVRHKEATITLKAGGRVRIYAYLREGCKNPRYILTNAVYKHPPSTVTVYRDYYHRWPIEEAHRDLKQQFGLGSFKNRAGEQVNAFIQFIYTGYSVFCWMRFRQLQLNSRWITAPAFQDRINALNNFHPPVNQLAAALS